MGESTPSFIDFGFLLSKQGYVRAGEAQLKLKRFEEATISFKKANELENSEFTQLLIDSVSRAKYNVLFPFSFDFC